MSFPTATAHSPNTDRYASVYPRVYACDDDIDRLIVFNRDNDFWHGKECFGELLAGRLGQLIDAPVPVFVPVYVPDEVVADLQSLPFPGLRDPGGWHVGIEKPNNPGPFGWPLLQTEIANLSGLAIKTALAAWLDTNARISYFDDENRVWFSRFNAAFSGDIGPIPWTAETLATPPRKLRWFLFGHFNHGAPFIQTIAGYWRVPANVDSLYAAADAIAGISAEAIHDAVYTDVPAEWNMPAEDLAAVEARLLYVQPILRAKLDGAIYRARHPRPAYDRWPAPYDA
jgi:hypothetical protein